MRKIPSSRLRKKSPRKFLSRGPISPIRPPSLTFLFSLVRRHFGFSFTIPQAMFAFLNNELNSIPEQATNSLKVRNFICNKVLISFDQIIVMEEWRRRRREGEENGWRKGKEDAKNLNYKSYKHTDSWRQHKFVLYS